MRGAMLQIMQLQGGPRSQYASDITGKYSRTFPDPVCCRILRNDAKYSPGNMRGHLSQGALPQSGRCALSALVSPPARFSDKCCPGIVITQINTGLAGEGRAPAHSCAGQLQHHKSLLPGRKVRVMRQHRVPGKR